MKPVRFGSDRRVAWFAIVVLSALAGSSTQALGQAGGGKEASGHTLEEPSPYRVYQRDRAGMGRIPIVAKDKDTDMSKWTVSLGVPESQPPVTGYTFEDGVVRNVPTGGPYTLTIETGGGSFINIGPVFVGDLWILSGQSNMEGVGELVDVTPPNPSVMLLGMNGAWAEAKEPLHWLVDSPDPVHSGDQSNRAERSKGQHQNRTKGAGLGLPFGVAMSEALGVPIGLVACAHGGTSMEQWNAAKKDEEGKSLYGSMLRQFRLAGGKVKGVLWYQGESDANPNAAPQYAKVMEDFIAAVRRDFNQPDLPFYLVQIGRFAIAGDSKHWNTVQDAERLIPSKIAHTGVISVIDLELDDGIHVGTQGHKRAGHRLANLALRELFGHTGGSTPTFDTVFHGQNTLIVKFKGVNLIQEENKLKGLQPAKHIAGFSIRNEDGAELPLFYEAFAGPGPNEVTLKLNGAIPEKSFLWYGWGYNPYCNLTDHWDMAVPVFGPIALDAPK